MKRQGAKAPRDRRLDQIAWLLNIRGEDILYTPVVIGYVVRHRRAAARCTSTRARSPSRCSGDLGKRPHAQVSYKQVWRDLKALGRQKRAGLDRPGGDQRRVDRRRSQGGAESPRDVAGHGHEGGQERDADRRRSPTPTCATAWRWCGSCAGWKRPCPPAGSPRSRRPTSCASSVPRRRSSATRASRRSAATPRNGVDHPLRGRRRRATRKLKPRGHLPDRQRRPVPRRHDGHHAHRRPRQADARQKECSPAC